MKQITRRGFLHAVGASAAAGISSRKALAQQQIQGFEETATDTANWKKWTPVSDRIIRVGIAGLGGPEDAGSAYSDIDPEVRGLYLAVRNVKRRIAFRNPVLGHECAVVGAVDPLRDAHELDLEAARQKALRCGAVACHILDQREEFVRDFVFPAVRAARSTRNSTWFPDRGPR